MKVKLMEKFCPKIEIDLNAMNKMKQYVHQSDLEIGWLGTASKLGNTYIIEDVFLFKQEVNATTTEITTEGLNEFAMGLLSQENGVETWNKMKVWGHSHVHMDTSPSMQDNEQVNVFSDNADDFFIRIIANKKDDYRIDLYDYTTGVLYEELPYTINYGKDSEIIESLYRKIDEIKQLINVRINPSQELKAIIASEIKLKVKKKEYGTISGGFDDYCNYFNGYNNKKPKKNETKEEKSKVLKIFDELSNEDRFEIMIHLNNGIPVYECLGLNLSYAEETDLEMLIEDFCNEFYQEFYEYENAIWR